MITKPQRERLHQFFAGYFHEDWSVEAKTPEQVLRSYIRQRRASSELQELGRCIVAFVHDHPDERDLSEALFKELGCYYSPQADGISTRSWLLDVAAKFAAARSV